MIVHVAMIRPNSDGVYAISGDHRQPVGNLDDYGVVDGLISFDEDGVSNPVKMPMYGKGLDCWYIEDSEFGVK